MGARVAAAWIALVALGPAAATAAAGLETAAQIDACYRANFPDSTAVQTVSFQARDRIGAINTSRATLHWKKFDDGRSKVLIRFAKPAEMRGAGLLMIEKAKRNDMFMYLPELAKVRRITKTMTSASMFGTDFSYEEFERIQGIAEDAMTERLDDAEADGRPTYVLLATPGREQESRYARIKTWIDKETCTALRSEFFERDGEPRKVMTAPFESVEQIAGLWLPREIRMLDLRDETDTTLRVEEVEIGVDVPRKLFSEKELVSGAR